MDFMILAGVRFYLANRTLSVLDEVRMCLDRQRPPFGAKINIIMMEDRHEVSL